MSTGRIAVALLALAVLASALGVVYSKHRNRQLYVQLQDLQQQRDAMEVEWGQLQLEQSTLATQGYIERVARKKLKMQIPDMDAVVMVR